MRPLLVAFAALLVACSSTTDRSPAPTATPLPVVAAPLVTATATATATASPTATATPTAAATDPRPAIEYLTLMSAGLSKFFASYLDVLDDPVASDASVRWDQEGLTRLLHFDLQYGPDLTPHGVACEEAHQQMRTLIRATIHRAGVSFPLWREWASEQAWREMEQAHEAVKAASIDWQESMYRCERAP